MENEHNDDQYMHSFCIETTLVTETTIVGRCGLNKFEANFHVLSYEMWESLGKPNLLSTQLCFISFSKTETPSLGSCYLKVRTEDQPIYSLFYVAYKNEVVHSIVLGTL